MPNIGGDNWNLNRRELYSVNTEETSTGNRVEVIQPNLSNQVVETSQVFPEHGIPGGKIGPVIDTGNAGITSLGEKSTDVRFWAGSSFENRYTAPFQILKNGTLVLSAVSNNSITIGYNSNIIFAEGGDINFTSISNPTTFTVALIADATGLLTSSFHYQYAVTFVTADGESTMSIMYGATTDATHLKMQLTNLQISSSVAVLSKNIYRNKPTDAAGLYLLDNISNATTSYVDNIPDASLGLYDCGARDNTTSGKIKINNSPVLTFSSSNVTLGVGARPSSLYNGQNSVFIGSYSGYNTISAIGVTSIGADSMRSATSVKQNVSIGYSSSYKFTTASYNTAIGAHSLRNNVTGDNNVSIGYWSGYDATGSNNIFIGRYAGYSETGSNSFIVDNFARGSESASRNTALIYGVTSEATPANQFVKISNNLGINTQTFGTSAIGVLGLATGTAPSTSPADMVQLFSTDISAGNATLGIRTETAVVAETNYTKFNNKLPVKINGTTYYIMLTTT